MRQLNVPVESMKSNSTLSKWSVLGLYCCRESERWKKKNHPDVGWFQEKS